MAAPLAKRLALTGGVEPVKSGQMQPGGTLLLYAADVGGNENFQLYLKDTTDPKAPPVRLTDGKSRNIEACWSRDGRRIAFSTNRRNGKDSDIVIKEIQAPYAERVVHTGTSPGWGPVEWSPDGTLLLLRQSMGQEESRLWTMDVATAQKTQITRTRLGRRGAGRLGRRLAAHRVLQRRGILRITLLGPGDQQAPACAQTQGRCDEQPGLPTG